MQSQKKKIRKRKGQKDGFALVMALMALLLLTGLGLALAVNSNGEIIISGSFRKNEKAFFAADAGVGLARLAIRSEIDAAVTTRANALATNLGTNGVPTASQLSTILTDSFLTDSVKNDAPIQKALSLATSRATVLGSNGRFDVQMTLAPDGPPVGTGDNMTVRFRYTITATGYDSSAVNPLNATAQAVESGVIVTTLRPDRDTGTPPVFSKYGTFIDKYGYSGSSAFASGVFSGPVHTNEGFLFRSTNSVTFRDKVTQAFSNYKYHNGSAWAEYPVSSTDRTGLDFQKEYEVVPAIAPPINANSQELAVLNQQGWRTADPNDVEAPVALAELTANLMKADGTSPTAPLGYIPDGVYLPSTDKATMTGGGIYVKGNASDLRLSVSGNSQIYTITQGGTVTTITVNYSTNTTTISSGASTRTVAGIPMNKSNPSDPTGKPGASIYVQGNIEAIHGPAAVSGTTGPAVASNTAVTVTSTGNIKVTGDLKYQTPTLDNTGLPIAGSENAANVLGIFTNSGAITTEPNAAYTTNGLSSNSSDRSAGRLKYTLSLDAAIAAFHSTNTSSGGWITQCSHCSSDTTISLRGSRSASRALPYYGYGRPNRYFDERFRNGTTAPPFFPVAGNLTPPILRGIDTIASTESFSWRRVNN